MNESKLIAARNRAVDRINEDPDVSDIFQAGNDVGANLGMIGGVMTLTIGLRSVADGFAYEDVIAGNVYRYLLGAIPFPVSAAAVRKLAAILLEMFEEQGRVARHLRGWVLA